MYAIQITQGGNNRVTVDARPFVESNHDLANGLRNFPGVELDPEDAQFYAYCEDREAQAKLVYEIASMLRNVTLHVIYEASL